jgi:hypothetical protein
LIKSNLGPTGGTLDILFDPSPQAGQMEDMATSKLLRQRHFIKAYDAGGINTYSSGLILEIDIWKAFQLVHKRP